MSRRNEQLTSSIHRGVQSILDRGLQDPRVRGLITVTEVRLSQDMSEAVVVVSVLPEDKQDLTMHGLRAAASHVRHELSDLLELRRTPRLTFKLNKAFKKQAEVLRALTLVEEERLRRGLAQPPPGGEESPASPDDRAP
jgi:ribosome-binding factor A